MVAYIKLKGTISFDRTSQEHVLSNCRQTLFSVSECEIIKLSYATLDP